MCGDGGGGGVPPCTVVTTATGGDVHVGAATSSRECQARGLTNSARRDGHRHII